MQKRALFLTIVCALLISGCAGREKIEECVLDLSGIAENEDYQQARQLQEKGLVNAEGEYKEDEYTRLREELQTIEEKEQKQVHVTIAENNFLKIEYYLDSARTDKLEEPFIYMNPGDRLYCSQPESKNDSNAYVFSEFRIYEYDSDGKKGKLYAAAGEESLVLEIPQDYKGTELEIVPVGRYEKQGLTFRAFYYDSNGNEKNASGIWSVDGVVYNDNAVEIDASKPYTVKYEYDGETYYYVDAQPAPFSAEQTGVVEFKKSDRESMYTVTLHPYFSADFIYDSKDKKGIESVAVNNREQKAGDGISNLKAGDHITVTTNENYRIFCSNFGLDEPEKVEGGYRYTITVLDSNQQELEFMVAKSDLEIVLNKSVGVDILFDITASGLDEKNCHYSSDAKKDLTIFQGSIGIEEKVSITAKDGVMDAGNVLKVVIEKTDGNDAEITETKYIEKLPGTVDIALYDKTEEIANLDKIFRSVKVNISLIPAEIYHVRSIKNGTVSVKLEDSPEQEALLEGSVVEPSWKVEISLIPDEGYYISGKNVDNDRFTQTMKYSRYMSSIDKIIEEHQIKKLYQITLDTADEYGQCVYKWNGKKITENTTINIREEDELVLEYNLTADGYQIMRQEQEGAWDKFIKWGKDIFSKEEESLTIPITREIDGTTIKREDYIKIKKGE